MANMIVEYLKNSSLKIIRNFRKEFWLHTLLTLVHLGLFVVLYGNKETPATDKVVLFFLTLSTSQIFIYGYKKKYLKPYFRNRWLFVLLILCVTYVAFASWGNKLFLHPVNFHDASAWFSFLLITLWVVPVVVSILYVWEYLQALIRNTSGKITTDLPTRKAHLFFFVISFGIGITYLIAFNPGILSYDSYHQWHQAIGEYPLTDWHPVFHTLIFRLLISVYPSPLTIAFAQVVFFSLVFSSLMIFLHKQGVSLSILLVFNILMVSNPNVGLLIVSLFKDTPYGISILWVTLLLAKTITRNKNYIKSLTYQVELITSLIFVFFFRQNGMLVYSFTLLFLVLFFFRNKTFKPLLSLSASIVLIILIKGPLYQRLEVNPAPAGNKFLGMYHDIAGVYIAGGRLHETTFQWLDNVADLDTLKVHYYPYWVKTAPLKPAYHETTFKEIATAYIRTFWANPAIMINNILLRTDIYWGIPTGKDGFIGGINYRGIDTRPYYSLQVERWNNFFSRVLHRVSDFTTTWLVLINVFWRYGLWMALFVVISLFVVKNRKGKMLIIAIPVLANIVSLILSSGWLDHRYGWSIVLTIPFFMLYSLYFPSESDNSHL